MKRFVTVLLSGALLSLSATAAEPVPVAVVINPYNGDRAGPETDGDAQAMFDGGLADVIGAAGGRLVRHDTVAPSDADERQYGRWNRFGLASGHLADHAARNAAAGSINLGLYNNCSSLMGMLGGLRHTTEPARRVGLVWIDAHGDYNTPECAAIEAMFRYPKTEALGLASYPHRDDPGKVTLNAIQELVRGAVREAAQR